MLLGVPQSRTIEILQEGYDYIAELIEQLPNQITILERKTGGECYFGLSDYHDATAALFALCPVPAGYRPEPHGKAALYAAA